MENRFTHALICLFITLLCCVTASHAQIITTVAGGIGEDSSATTHGRLNAPTSIAWDPAGDLYIWESNLVRKVDHTTGKITTLRMWGLSGSYAYFGYIDNNWNMYYTTGGTIEKIDTLGNITRVVGTGTTGFSGDGGLATAAQINNPGGIVVDATGNLYIADADNDRIRKVGTSGIISTIAGGGPTLGDGGPAISAMLNNPTSVAIDGTGNIFIADRYNNRIRKVNTSGIISTITSGFITAVKIVCDPLGNVYAIDNSGSKVTNYNTAGFASTYAGGGSVIGDGGPAIAANLINTADIKIDATGNIYVADQGNNRIRKVNTAGIISTVAGNGVPVFGNTGNGSPAIFAAVDHMPSLSSDVAGNIYLPFGNAVRKLNTAGVITQIAGNGIIGFSGDGGPATAAQVDNVVGAVSDKFGNIYLAVNGSRRIRKVSPSGLISTIAGGGIGGLGDGGPATAAVMTTNGIAVDTIGNVYIADTANHRIRKVDVSSGIITTIAGTGTRGSAGDGAPAIAANLNTPTGLIFDKSGNLYFSDGSIRKIDPAGNISSVASGTGFVQLAVDRAGKVYYPTLYGINVLDTAGFYYTIAGNGTFGIGSEGVVAITSYAAGYNGVAMDTAGNLFISDWDTYNYSAIRKVCCLNSLTGHPPFFKRGRTQTLTVCQNSTANPLDTFLTITDPDLGNKEKWSILTQPTHGSLSGFQDSALSTGGFLTSTRLRYTPTTGYNGSDQFIIKISDGTFYTTTTVSVTVSRLPSAITGPSAICTGLGTTLSDATFGGRWSSSNITIATVDTVSGIVTGVAAGTANITYTTSGVCTVSKSVTVNNSPSPVTGTASICAGATTTLANATPAGTWSSSNTARALVGSSSGVVTGVSAGTVSISYTIASGCPAIKIVTVSPLPNAGAITGAAFVCAGSTITLLASAPGGVWSSSNATASVSTTGIVSAITAGTDTIRYTATNSCGADTAIRIITISPIARASVIAGPAGVCVGASIALTDSVSGGVWSSVDPYVLVFGGGVITGISPGTATISYTISGSCGTATVTRTIAVNSVPYAGVITGSTLLCTGGTTALADAIPGGTWSSGNPFVASISSTGVVTGMAVGGAIVSYNITNACGVTAAIAFINVNPATPISPVTGPSTVCAGNSITLSDPTPAGTWSSGNVSVATVSSTGIVTGVAPGVVAISYTGSLGCGVSVATFNITVNAAPSAGAITGTSSLCGGVAAILSSYAPGGVWSSSNAHATISPTGIVTGVSAGTDTIMYAVTNSCGTATVSHTITVYPAPAPGSISGASVICAATTTALTNSATGGAWSSSASAIAIVGSTGIVSGIAAGTTFISYTVTTGCGIAAATKTITVNAPDAGFISGVTTLCGGGTSALTNVAPGGIWTSSNPAVASVSASGLVTAIAAGASLISYSVTTSCGTAVSSVVFTVGALLLWPPLLAPAIFALPPLLPSLMAPQAAYGAAATLPLSALAAPV